MHLKSDPKCFPLMGLEKGPGALSSLYALFGQVTNKGFSSVLDQGSFLFTPLPCSTDHIGVSLTVSG